MRLAAEAYAERRIADALDAWRQLWEIDPSPLAACQIGMLSHDTGLMPEAVRWLSRCLRMSPPAETAQERERQDIRRLALANARQRVGLLVISAPPGAVVTVDGQPVDITKPVPVEPGHHVVRVNDTEVAVGVAAGETRQVPPAVHASEAPRARPEPKQRPAPVQRVAVLAVGAAATTALIVTGAGLLVVAVDSERDRNQAVNHAGPGACFFTSSSLCRDAVNAHGTMQAQTTWGTVAVVAGSVAGAATLTYALFPQRMEVTATAAGLAVRGTW